MTSDTLPCLLQPLLLRQPPLLEDSCVPCDKYTRLCQQRRQKWLTCQPRNVTSRGAGGDIAGSIVMSNAVPASQIPIGR